MAGGIRAEGNRSDAVHIRGHGPYLTGFAIGAKDEVVAVGDSDEVKVRAGDVVVLAKYSGTEVKIEGEEHLIVDADDILGLMED